MTSLFEKLQNRRRILSQVLDNLRETKEISDTELRLESNRQRARDRDKQNGLEENEDRWATLLDWHGNIKRSDYGDTWRANNEVYNRSMTKETFELGLRNAITNYEKEDDKSEDDEIRLTILRDLLVEHLATPYTDGGKDEI